MIRDAFDNNGHLTVPQAIDRERQKLDSIIALNVDAFDAGRIAGVSGTEFELLVAKLFEKLGFQVDATGSTLLRIAVLRPDPLMIPTTQRAWRRS